MPTEKIVGILHDPEKLKSLAKQLREEAHRAEARAAELESGKATAGCQPGCWNVLSTCIYVQPL
jgi:hypothetical protein